MKNKGYLYFYKTVHSFVTITIQHHWYAWLRWVDDTRISVLWKFLSTNTCLVEPHSTFWNISTTPDFPMDQWIRWADIDHYCYKVLYHQLGPEDPTFDIADSHIYTVLYSISAYEGFHTKLLSQKWNDHTYNTCCSLIKSDEHWPNASRWSKNSAVPSSLNGIGS